MQVGCTVSGPEDQFPRGFRAVWPDGFVVHGVEFPSGRCVIDSPADNRLLTVAVSFEALQLHPSAKIEWDVHGPGYRSSACAHAPEPGREALHLECQTNAIRYDGSPKVAAQCKYGNERCTCPCHDQAGGAPN